MTLRGKLLSFFPAAHITLILAAAIQFTSSPHLQTLLLIPCAAYLFPLLAFHVHNQLAPLREGTFSIVQGYSPWFGTHMIQQGFIALPALENLLRLYPGLFALWLRAWGAKVGKGVYFAPGFEIADRSLLSVGDHVIFGYGVKMSSHYISPSREYGGMKIYLKRVEFEDRCFVGATSRFGPGVRVLRGAMVKAASDHYPNAVIEARPS